MQNLTDKELEARYLAELVLRMQQHDRFSIDIPVDTAAALFAILQSVERRPLHRQDMTAAFTIVLRQKLEDYISLSPAMAESARRGWCDEFDEVANALPC